MFRYKIEVEYDGTPFCGWQRQSGVVTVQECLEKSIYPLSKKCVTVYGSGRTDTGVHAIAQVAHFDLDMDIDCFRVQECMNAHLRDYAISVLSVERVNEHFDARFSAIERSYIYKIINRRSKLALEQNRAWRITEQLDVEKMHNVAQCLVGKHDFSAFRAAGCQSSSPVKTLNSICIERDGNLILFRVSARSFLYHQVRNIVGSLYFVGNGKWSEMRFIEVFRSKDRTQAGMTAPACGLYFEGVKYE